MAAIHNLPLPGGGLGAMQQSSDWGDSLNFLKASNEDGNQGLIDQNAMLFRK